MGDSLPKGPAEKVSLACMCMWLYWEVYIYYSTTFWCCNCILTLIFAKLLAQLSKFTMIGCFFADVIMMSSLE